MTLSSLAREHNRAEQTKEIVLLDAGDLVHGLHAGDDVGSVNHVAAFVVLPINQSHIKGSFRLHQTHTSNSAFCSNKQQAVLKKRDKYSTACAK